MSITTAENLLQYFYGINKNPVSVCLTGLGEPLLSPCFFDIVELTRQCFPDTWICVNSNGTHLSRSVIQKICDSSIDAFCVSLRFSNQASYNRYCRADLYWRVVEKTKMLLAMKGDGTPNVHIQAFRNHGLLRFYLQWLWRLNRNDTITIEKMLDLHYDSDVLLQREKIDESILVSDIDGNLYDSCLSLWRDDPLPVGRLGGSHD